MQKNENAILRNSLQMMMNKLKNCKLIGSYVSLNDKDIQENIVDGNNQDNYDLSQFYKDIKDNVRIGAARNNYTNNRF